MTMLHKQHRVFKVVLLFSAAVLSSTQSVRADADDFASFIVGQSINGQGEWTVEDSFGMSGELFDERIVDDGSGNNVWRISNSFVATSYSNQPYSSRPDEIAGETGAELRNDYGTDHTMPLTPPLSTGVATSSRFYGAWDFKSATDGAQGTVGTPMRIGISAGISQSTVRQTFLRIVDEGSGFDLIFFDTFDGASFQGGTIATGLSYGDWHRVEMSIDFEDGVVDSVGDPYVDGLSDGVYGNDVVRIFLDGNLIHTGTTWESYYYVTSLSGLALPTVHAVDSLLFRMAASPNAVNAGAGFYFDNVETSNACAPKPDTVYVDEDYDGLPVGTMVNFPGDGGAGPFEIGCNAFATIQNGIDNVSGSTVNVAPGTYPGNIIVPAGVTCQSSGGAAVTTIAGAGGCAVTITGNGVTIDGFTITNPTGTNAICSDDNSTIAIRNNIVTNVGDTTVGGNHHAIVIESSAAAVDDVIIEDNVINNVVGSEISPPGSVSAIVAGFSTGNFDITNLMIQRNVISDIKASILPFGNPGGRGAYGIQINHGTGVTGKTVGAQILNNSIDDLEGLWAHAIGLEGNTPGAIVQNNAISNLVDHKVPSDAVGVMIEDNAGAGSISVNFNSFDTPLAVVNTETSGATLDFSANWWTSNTGPSVAGHPTGTGSEIGGPGAADVDYTPWLDTGTDTDLVAIGFQGDLSTLNVDDDSPQFGPTNRIQEGINLVTASTVNVLPGVYPGSLSVSIPVNLLGPEAGNCATGRTAGAATEAIIDLTGVTGGILITSGGVVVDGFEILGDLATNYGIYVAASGSSLSGIDLKNNFIHGMGKENAGNGSNASYGILGDGGVGNIDALLIDCNEIYDIGGIAQTCEPGSVACVSTGLGVSLHEVGGAPGVTITNNSFHDIEDGDLGGTPVPGAAVAIQGNGAGPAPSSGIAVGPNTYADVTGGVAVFGFGTIDEACSNFTNVVIAILNIGNLATVNTGLLGSYATTDMPTGFPGSTTYHCTIQGAIDASDPGATIDVSAGSFPENIVIDRSVTLQSATGAAATTIAGGGGCAVTIASDGVTIDGFTITNPTGTNAICSDDHSTIAIRNNIVTNVGGPTVGGNHHAILISSSAAAVDDVTIEDNVINDITGSEISPPGSVSAIVAGFSTGNEDITNLVIQRNVISDIDASILPFGNPGGRGAYGILLNHGTGVTGKTVGAQILDNAIEDLEGLWTHAIGLEGNTPGAIVQNNAISDLTDHKVPSDAVGVMIEDNAGAGSIMVNFNSFDTPLAVVNTETAGAILDFSANWWTSNTGPTVASHPTGTGSEIGGPGSADVDYTPWLDTGTDTDLVAIGFQGDLSTLHVDDDSPQFQTVGRIQEGIDLVTASTVIVHPGTYVEVGQVLVDKDVDIIGLDPQPTVMTDQDTGSSGDARGWWLVDAGKVLNITNLAFDGTGFKVYQGFRHRGTGSFTGCAFREIKFNESGPTYSGVGVAAFGSAGPVDFTDCTFEEMGRIGVLYFGAGVAGGTFDGNTYTGKGVGDWLDYFVDLSNGATATFTDNLVCNNRGVASSDGSTSAGVLITTFFGPGTAASMTGNTIVDNTTGVFVGFDSGDTSAVVVNDNLIYNNDNGMISTSVLVDAENNWWGDSTGPEDLLGTDEADNPPCFDPADMANADGLGNDVTDLLVDYCPWTLGSAELSLEIASCTGDTGDQIVVEVWMRNLASSATGFEASLSFDTAFLTYNGGASAYTLAPFDTHTLAIAGAEVAAGVLDLDGFDSGAIGTAADSLLATLVFDVVQDCGPTDVGFAAASCLGSHLFDNTGPIATDLLSTGEITLDNTAPVLDCPLDATIECDESTDPNDVNVTFVEPFDMAPVIGALQAPGVWYTDRYAPFGFTNALFDGDNRLKHSIDAGDCSPCRGGSFSSAFYDTQGRKYDLLSGTSRMTIELYIPSDWATTERRMAGFWGTGFDAGAAVSAFPIIEFTSTTDDSGVPRFRGWHNGTGWIDMGLPSGFAYDTWHLLEIDLAGDDFVYTVGDLQLVTPAFGTVEIGNLILQGHNDTAGVTYDIYWDNFATAQSAQATDNCDPAPVITFSDNEIPGSCADEFVIERSWTATDDCGNSSSCVQNITVVDTTSPVITCPPDINSGCSQFVTLVTPTATDNCDPAPGITGVRSDGQALTNLYPVGDTTITWTATDDCGNTDECDQLITVESEQPVDVDVELEGVGTVTRCITFTVYNCTTMAEFSTTQEIDFTAGLGLDTIMIPCGDWDCITAKDQLHTLASNVSLVDMSGTLTADFTGTDELLAGDLTDDNRVDILDFGAFVGQNPSSLPPDTTCAEVPPPAFHADFNGDGLVNTLDYAVFTIRFFVLGDGVDDCCPMPTTIPPFEGELMASSVSVQKLGNAIGRPMALKADLDRNGVFDRRDVVLFEKAHDLGSSLSDLMLDESPLTIEATHESLQSVRELQRGR